MAGNLIDSTEMYLRTVLELEEEGVPALRARLAERLDLSAPSVSEGVSRLENDGLLKLDENRVVHLTPEGRPLAERVLRKHRLAERLLVDVLGVEPEHVHEEACRWEHVISDRVEEKLIEFLGDPDTSPYGNPIRSAGTPRTGIATLADAPDGELQVISISEQLQGDYELMHAFDSAGVGPGTVVTRQSSGPELEISVDGKDIPVEAEQAKLIFVAVS